jgi:hypothetical protein
LREIPDIQLDNLAFGAPAGELDRVILEDMDQDIFEDLDLDSSSMGGARS